MTETFSDGSTITTDDTTGNRTWTHATWLVFEDRRKRMAPWLIEYQAALHAYYRGPLPIVATLGKGYYLALRTLAD